MKTINIVIRELNIFMDGGQLEIFMNGKQLVKITTTKPAFGSPFSPPNYAQFEFETIWFDEYFHQFIDGCELKPILHGKRTIENKTFNIIKSNQTYYRYIASLYYIHNIGRQHIRVPELDGFIPPVTNSSMLLEEPKTNKYYTFVNYTFNVSDFEYLQDIQVINIQQSTQYINMYGNMLKQLSNFNNNYNVLAILIDNDEIVIEKNPLPPKNIINDVNHGLLEELAKYDKKYEGLQQRYENLSRMYDNLDEELSSQHMFNKKLTSEMSEVMAMVHDIRELKNIVDQNNSIVSMLANRISLMNPPPYSQ